MATVLAFVAAPIVEKRQQLETKVVSYAVITPENTQNVVKDINLLRSMFGWEIVGIKSFQLSKDPFPLIVDITYEREKEKGKKR